MKQFRTAAVALGSSLAVGLAVMAGPTFADDVEPEPCAKEQAQLDKAQAKLEELTAKLAEKKQDVREADTKAEKDEAKEAKEKVAKVKKAQVKRVEKKQEKLDECLAGETPTETPSESTTP